MIPTSYPFSMVKKKISLVQVPELQHSNTIVGWICEDVIMSRKSVMLAPEDCAIRKNKLLEKIKVMASCYITHIHWASTYGSKKCMEFGTNVIRLKHIPI